MASGGSKTPFKERAGLISRRYCISHPPDIVRITDIKKSPLWRSVELSALNILRFRHLEANSNIRILGCQYRGSTTQSAVTAPERLLILLGLFLFRVLYYTYLSPMKKSYPLRAIFVKLNCKSFHYKLFIGFNNLSKFTLLIVINTNPERGRAVNIRKDESYGIF